MAIFCKTDLVAITELYDAILADSQGLGTLAAVRMYQIADAILTATSPNAQELAGLINREDTLAFTLTPAGSFHSQIFKRLFQQFKQQVQDAHERVCPIIFQEDSPELTRYEPVLTMDMITAIKNGTKSARLFAKKPEIAAAVP